MEVTLKVVVSFGGEDKGKTQAALEQEEQRKNIISQIQEDLVRQ